MVVLEVPVASKFTIEFTSIWKDYLQMLNAAGDTLEKQIGTIKQSLKSPFNM